MHRGILNTVVVVLAGTVAPGVSAQTRAQAAAGAQQTTATSAASMMVAVPRMPNVIGLTADSATRLLVNARVLGRARTLVRRDSSTNSAPRDQVVDQQPRAGMPLSAIGPITIVVAIPSRRTRIPDSLLAQVVGGLIVPPTNTATTPPTGPASTTYVPQLVGRDARNALRTLAAVGLRLDRAVVVDFSDIVDSGFVYQQHPLPRTRVDTGSAVRIWISLGPRRTPVMTFATPNVLDRTLYDADRILRKSRLVIGHVDTIFRSGAGGLIAHQLPEPGDPTHPNDAVALQVAIAPPLITVPSVIGLRRADANAMLRQAGLELGQVTPITGRGSDTSIVRQTPPAQTAVVRGTFVDVDENQPVIRRRTIVPGVTGLTEASAEQRLAKDGLVLGRVVVADTGSAPLVVAQQPAANDSAFVNDRVSITLATPRVPLLAQQGKPTKVATSPTKVATTSTKPATTPPKPEAPVPLIAVPAVQNVSFELARTLINKAGLTTVSTTTDTGKVFIVRSQRPAAGSFVPAGAPVMVVLERFEIPHVPHLVGLTRAAAEAHATADGFTMSIENTRRVLLQLFDRVAIQEPDAQTIGRGDQVIHVDLATPLIPPLPAALAFMLLVTGVAAKAYDKSHGKSKPLTDLSIVIDTPSTAPISISTRDGHMIRTAITFTLDGSHGTWTNTPKDDSLIAHATTHA